MQTLKSLDEDLVVWKRIPNHPDYEVSSNGLVKSFKKRNTKILIPRIPRNGYKMLRVDNRYVAVHTLVLEAFVGPRPDGMEACHKNDIKTDNRISNLRWDTRKANYADRLLNNGIIFNPPKGEKHFNSKLTDNAIKDILESSLSQRDLAKKYGVNQSTISRVKSGSTWRDANPFVSA